MVPSPFSGTSRGPLEVAERDESREAPIRREDLRVLTNPRGRVAEQFRTFRNSIQAMNPDGAPRNLVVTSALPGEGKTTATLNLALALAEQPHLRVLVVDADLHRPAIEDHLGLPRRQGLAELLAGGLDLDRAIRPTSVPRLSVLGSGSLEGNPAQYLGTDRLKSILRTLKREFDYVVIDAPATLDFNDASQLALMADGTILAVRLGQTPKYLVEQAANVLEGLGANLLGTCVLGAE
ncbi:MAG: CpsD/CapB family tyrosine-protein kinase [Planctomycetota bacterium]|nr:CpsD/CapB family tyrosine-protein kinase [Planctomycetota bacterium]